MRAATPAPPGRQGGKQRRDQPVAMVERHHRNGGVLRAQPAPGDMARIWALMFASCIFGRPVTCQNMTMASSGRSPRASGGCVRLGRRPGVDRRRATRGAAVTADVHCERPPGGGFLPRRAAHPRQRTTRALRPGFGRVAGDGSADPAARRRDPARDAASKATTNSALLPHAQRDPVTGAADRAQLAAVSSSTRTGG